MKNYLCSGRGASLVIASLAFLFCSTFVPVAHARSTQLIIHRSPTFGSDTWLRVWVDGKEAQAVAWGHDFTAPISPGRHVIGVLDSDIRPNHQPTNTVVNVTAGQTYEFTAVRGHGGVSLLKN